MSRASFNPAVHLDHDHFNFVDDEHSTLEHHFRTEGLTRDLGASLC